MSRRAFNPTAEQRGNVEAMIGYGIPEAEICNLIKNPATGKPIDLGTPERLMANSRKPSRCRSPIRRVQKHPRNVVNFKTSTRFCHKVMD
jgi:hypothetical protein